MFSTRGLLARLQERGIHAMDVASAIQMADQNHISLEEIFAALGTDLGEFLQSFIVAFRTDALLITGGIAETWDRFAPFVIQSLSVSMHKGILGSRAALLGAAALYFQKTLFPWANIFR